MSMWMRKFCKINVYVSCERYMAPLAWETFEYLGHMVAVQSIGSEY